MENSGGGSTGLIWLCVLSLFIAVGGIFAVPGLFVIDEFVYFASAEAFGRTGWVAIDNGYETFGVEALRISDFLVPGPSGTVAQYPLGSAIISGALVSEFGPRGMIIVSTAFGIATLFMTRALALALYDDRRVADWSPILLLFGTFLAEFIYGVWPHTVSLFLILSALYAVVKALKTETSASGQSAAWIALAGATLGIGLFFRVDGVLLLGPLTALIILLAERPIRMAVYGAVGLLPFLAGSAYANFVKFGSLSPITYGRAEGGGNPAQHLPIILLGLAGLGFLIALRKAGRHRAIWLLLLASAGAITAAVAIPTIGSLVTRILDWAFAIVISSSGISPTSHGFAIDDAGITRIWTAPKEALVQSLPWLALPLAALLAPTAQGRALPYLLTALVFVGWVAPMSLIGFHGGFGFNMRYLLPVIPPLAILSVALWFDLIDRNDNNPRRAMALGLALGAVGLVTTQTVHPGGIHAVQQYLSLVFAALAALTVFVVFLPKFGTVRAAPLAQGALTACALIAAVGGAVDLTLSQIRRAAFAAASSELATAIGPDSVTFGLPHAYLFQLERPSGLIATGDPSELWKFAEAGLQVFVPDTQVDEILAENPTLRDTGARVPSPLGDALAQLTAKQ